MTVFFINKEQENNFFIINQDNLNSVLNTITNKTYSQILIKLNVLDGIELDFSKFYEVLSQNISIKKIETYKFTVEKGKFAYEDSEIQKYIDPNLAIFKLSVKEIKKPIEAPKILKKFLGLNIEAATLPTLKILKNILPKILIPKDQEEDFKKQKDRLENALEKEEKRSQLLTK